MFKCEFCGDVRRSLLHAMDHRDACQPPEAPLPEPETLRAYLLRIG